MPETRAKKIAIHIAEALDKFNAVHPDVTVMEVLEGLHEVEHNLTEIYLAETPFEWRSR